MEVNASECRNGALVKQRFGEALESHWLKWSSTDSPKKNKFHDEYDLCDATGAEKSIAKDKGIACELGKVRPLILFEDVDITFHEDRGFIAAIQQIAEAAKGPLILTTNNKNLALPESLDRLELFFKMPTQMELLSHAYMVCVSEKVGVHPHVVKRFIECCKGDIRKTVMQLQFWCRGNDYVNGKKSERSCYSELLDLDSGHGILPELIPWSFSSELSELVERETAIGLSMMEEQHSKFTEIVEEDLDREMLESQEIDLNEECLEAKKEAMLSRNCSIQDDEFAPRIDISWDFSRSPGTPVSFSRKKGGRKLDNVLSSDSEDETHIDQLAETNGKVQFDFMENNCFGKSSEAKEETKCFPCSDIESRNQIDNPWRADDLSCVPESTYVVESKIDYGNEVSCNALSTFEVDETVGVCKVDWMTTEFPSPDKPGQVGKSLNRVHKLSDLPGNSCSKTAKYCAEEEDTLFYYMQAGASNQAMDECSRIDFKRRPINECGFRVVPNSVQESWKRLRATQLKKDISIDQKDAIRVVEIASRMTGFISEADLLLYKCKEVVNDFDDPASFISEKPELFSWSHDQWRMASTTFEHGFCSFAKELDAFGLELDSQKRLDLAMEMLSLTSNKMALAKLMRHDIGGNQVLEARTIERTTISPLTDTSRSGEMRSLSGFSDLIHSLIPQRVYMSLRGDAFHEYVSWLGKISRLEACRLSESSSIDNRKRWRRRGRTARHYLSTGGLMLSPEDISVMDNCTAAYGKKGTTRDLNLVVSPLDGDGE